MSEDSKTIENTEEKKNEIGTGKVVKNIFGVAFSNIIKLIAGILVGLVLPKIIGVSEYGYYKTFTLYTTYVGLFHFGIVDGIYIIYGGKNYDELAKEKFRFYTAFLFGLEFILSVILLLLSLFVFQGEYRYIFLFLAIYLTAMNLTYYYQYISQMTMRFRELSFWNIVQSVLISFCIVGMWLMNRLFDTALGYRLFTTMFVIVTCIISFAYVIIYRKISFGKMIPFREGTRDIGNFIKTGLPLLVANLCSSLILTIDRQFVNILFPNDTYSVYAFAYNILTMVTTAISAISTVIYPVLKRKNEGELKKNHSTLLSIILMIVTLTMAGYYPLCFIIQHFLPDYLDSIRVFRIIFPGLILSSGVTIVMHNYYKTMNKNTRFFLISFGILLLSIGFDFGAYFLFKTTTSLSMASIITLVIWYVVSEYYFIKNYKVKWIKNFLFVLVNIAAFYLITMIENVYLGFAVQLVYCIAVIFAFYGKMIVGYVRNRKHPKAEQ